MSKDKLHVPSRDEVDAVLFSEGGSVRDAVLKRRADAREMMKALGPENPGPQDDDEYYDLGVHALDDGLDTFEEPDFDDERNDYDD